MFHAINHPNLWNYCQLISLFVSQYQPMINQTLRSSTNKQYSIPTFHLFTKSGDTWQVLSKSICRLHSFTFCQSRLLYIVVFLNKLLLCAIFSWRSYLALSHFSVLTSAAFFLPASSFSLSLVANPFFFSSAAFLKSCLLAALLFLTLEISLSQQPGSFLRDRSRSS